MYIYWFNNNHWWTSTFLSHLRTSCVYLLNSSSMTQLWSFSMFYINTDPACCGLVWMCVNASRPCLEKCLLHSTLSHIQRISKNSGTWKCLKATRSS